MPITALPDPPSRLTPDTFRAKADALLAALPTFVTELNEVAVNITNAVANFQGAWADQTGAAAVPYAVSHSGQYWQLVSDLADVTAKEPGVDVEWIQIHGSVYRVNHTDADSPVTLTDASCQAYIVYTNTGATAETEMNLPAGGDGMEVNAIVTAAYAYTFTANGTETIRWHSSQSVAGGSIKSAVVGDRLSLIWSGTQWVATIAGTGWQLETS
jgi:hypothetical protein